MCDTVSREGGRGGGGEGRGRGGEGEGRGGEGRGGEGGTLEGYSHVWPMCVCAVISTGSSDPCH